MREGSSDHKEAPVYLAVMSADSRAPDTSTQPSVVDAREEGSQQSNVKERATAHPSTPSGAMGDPRSSENTMSAFEITSVSTYQEDLETSMHHHKGSADAESFAESAKKRGQSESSETEELARVQSVGVREQRVSEQVLDFTEKFLPLESAPNGPVMVSGLRRFRRVNNYARGRWDVQDAFETEERQESEQRGTSSNQNVKNGGSGGGGGGGGGLGRESPFAARRGVGGEGGGDLSQQHSRSSSELGGQAPDIAVTGEKDIHLDRSSTVAETASLSRNTSFSSLSTAVDKSVDGEEKEQSRLKELEGEPDVTYPAGAQTQLVVEALAGSSLQQIVSTQAHTQPEATLPNSNITAGSESGGEDGQHDNRPSYGGEHRVTAALSHLNEELKRMISENKEIDALKEEVKKLKELNSSLFKENQQLRERNQTLLEEKERLQRDCNQLTQDLKLKSAMAPSEDSSKSQLGDS